MLKLKRNVLTAALTSAIWMVATGVHAETSTEAAAKTEAEAEAEAQAGAQEQAKTEAEREEEARRKQATELAAINVTGIRRGIEASINVKKDAVGIVEAISAEDIGKLPDISIADSIARLPGLTAQRVAGRASTVSIRGLAGDYGTTLLNGREQVSVGDNRTVEFDQYPSELISQVVVYKTPDAKLIGQGLSGTLDLRTVRPLSFEDRTVSVNLRAEKNSIGELNEEGDDLGNRFSAFYLDQFMDGNLGIALGYARLDSPGQASRWEAWGYPSDIQPAAGNFTLGGQKIQASSTDNVRQGFMGVLEYNASDNWQTMLDLYYSKFEKAETTRFLETGLGWSGARLSNPTIRDGVVVSGTFTGIRPVLRNDLNEGDDNLFAIGWNNVFRINDDWTAVGDISYSDAEREESILETYSGSRAGVTGSVDFTLSDRGFPRMIFNTDYADPSRIVLTDPGGWGQDGYIKTPQIDDSLRSGRLSFERQFLEGHFSSVEFGVNYADREKSRRVPEAFLDLLQDETVVPANLLVRPVDLGHTGGNLRTLSYRINPVLDQFYRFRDNINADIVNKQWTVEEQITTAYLQGNVNTYIGDVAVRGNVGVQAQLADQSSNGFSVIQGNAANAVPFSGESDYTDYLPSLNLSFDFQNENVLRMGLARQLARPRVDQMRANNNTSLAFSGQNIGIWDRSGGNPELEPWIANAADVSWERYFGERGYVSLAYFYKDLRSYVFDQRGTFDASDLRPPTGYTGPTPNPVGIFNRPANGEGGNIKGFEFSVSIPFDLFSEALEGFGIVGSYSDTSSSIKRLGPDGPDEPIAGLSEQVDNIQFYYENHGFSARVSRRHRSDFLGEIQGFGADRALVFIDGESVVDFQIGYAFSTGMLKGVSALLQVNNVTDEPYREYYPNFGDLSRRVEEYGRQYLLGVTYKF
jgi:iron complex outermembrane receptor protein